MHVLIDADLVCYRCAASVGDGAEDIAHARCDTLVRELIHTTNSEYYTCFLTGQNNFRKQINPEYKANRKDTVPPQWLQSCRQFLVQEWNAIVSDGCEADDLLGITQTEDSIIASLDKDLLMIPGNHYNWVNDEFTTTTPLDGLRCLYRQMLIGDRADNIFGVDGIGKVKAARIIDVLDDEQDMIETVFSLYKEDVERFIMNAQCLWILQREGETWAHRVNPLILPDQLQQGLEVTLKSMKSFMESTSMEPTMIQIPMFGTPANGICPESMEAESLPLT